MDSRKAALADWLGLFRVRNYPNYLVVIVAALAVSGGNVPVKALAIQFLLFGLCLYNGIYIVNEVLDVDLDRRHPVKRHRPVASGRITQAQALLLAGCLWAIAFVAADPVYAPLYLGFIGINLLYSLVLKRRGFRNVIAVTSALRVSLGFVVAGQPPLAEPALMLLCTLFMASVQQVKFHAEGTIGHRHSGAKLLGLASAMVPVGIVSAPAHPIVVAWTAFAMVAWVYVPWRFPRAARWLIGADVPEHTRSASDQPLPDMVVFDVDGTLCDSMRAIQQAVNEMAPKMGFAPVTEERYREFRTLSVFEIQKVLGLSAWQLARLGRHARRTLYERMDSLKPVSGIPEALQDLRRRGYRLGIVSSNHERNVKAFLRAHGMDCFDEIVTHRGLGSGLRRKRVQLRALMDACRHEAGRFVYVGDEIRDIEAARAVGMPALAVTWGANTAEALARAAPTSLVETPGHLSEAVGSALADPPQPRAAQG